MMAETLRIEAAGPYDLRLSLEAARAFSPEERRDEGILRLPLRLGGRLVLAELRQTSGTPVILEARVRGRLGEAEKKELHRLVGRVAWAGLDLRPFYCLASRHPVMGEVAGRLRGLKPLRPATVFEMAVIALTEQQISMRAAYQVRRMLLEKLGERVDGETAFPTPRRLASSSMAELRTCGLSERKAQYLLELSRRVAAGEVDLEALEGWEEEKAREYLTSLRGFGPWTASYILARGLGIPDVVPSEDLGVRTVTGTYLGGGGRVGAEEALRLLRPFVPFRGLAAFYLLAQHRLAEQGDRGARGGGGSAERGPAAPKGNLDI